MGINNIPAFADNSPVLIYIPALGRFQKQKSFIIIDIPALFFDFFEVQQARVLSFPLFSGGWPLVGPLAQPLRAVDNLVCPRRHTDRGSGGAHIGL
jgi:hypothetical protein